MKYLPPSDIDPAARSVIRRKKRALCRSPRWYAPGDRQDVVQELATHAHWISAQFDPAKGDAVAFYETALTHRLRDLVSFASAECRDWRRSVPLLDPASVPCPKPGNIPLRLDVRSALQQAPEPLRQLALELTRATLATAARNLGLSRQQARHQRDLLARHFTACGLDPRSCSN